MTNGLHVRRRPVRHPVPERRLWLPLLVTILLIAGGCAVGLARAQSLEDETFALTQAADALVATPTATPAPTAEPTRYAPSSRGGREAVAELAAAHFPPAWVPWVLTTSKCESGWDLYAYSAGFDRKWGVFYEHVGALQVDGVSWRHLADGPFLEPGVNFAVAAVVLARQGRAAWPWCGR